MEYIINNKTAIEIALSTIKSYGGDIKHVHYREDDSIEVYYTITTIINHRITNELKQMNFDCEVEETVSEGISQHDSLVILNINI